MKQSADFSRRARRMARKRCFQLGAILFFRRFCKVLAAVAFAGGCVILAGRVLSDSWDSRLSLALMLAAPAAAICCGIVILIRRLPDSGRMLIWLDSHTPGSDALTVASLEGDIGEWAAEARLPAAVPRFHWQPWRTLLFLLPGLLFLFGAACCPLPVNEEQEKRALELSEEKNRIEQKLELLAEEQLIPVQQEEELRTTLEELAKENDARDSSRTYELLETLEKRADSIGENAAQQNRERSESLEMLASGSEMLANLDDEALRRKALAELAEVARQLAADPELAELLKNAGISKEMNLNDFDPEMLRKLSENLGKNIEKLKEQLKRLEQAKLCKKSGSCQSGNCSKEGNCSGGSCSAEGDALERLEAWLAANSMESENLMAVLAACTMPGSGDVSRGRGDAPLNFSGDTRDSDAARRDINLPGQEKPESTGSVLAEFRVSPEEAGAPADVKAGSLQGGGAAYDERNLRIHPAHRAVVEKYFQPTAP